MSAYVFPHGPRYWMQYALWRLRWRFLMSAAERTAYIRSRENHARAWAEILRERDERWAREAEEREAALQVERDERTAQLEESWALLSTSLGRQFKRARSVNLAQLLADREWHRRLRGDKKTKLDD